MEQYLILAENWHTPVPYWENLPLRRFFRWIGTHNRIHQKRKEQQKK